MTDLTRTLGFSPAGVARMLSQDGNDLVYAILDQASRAVKIGRTGGRHPVERLKALQTGCPNPLVLLAWTHGKEAAYHRVLSGDRLRGEWFRLTPRVLAVVKTFDWLDTALAGTLPPGPIPGPGMRPEAYRRPGTH